MAEFSERTQELIDWEAKIRAEERELWQPSNAVLMSLYGSVEEFVDVGTPAGELTKAFRRAQRRLKEIHAEDE